MPAVSYDCWKLIHTSHWLKIWISLLFLLIKRGYCFTANVIICICIITHYHDARAEKLSQEMSNENILDSQPLGYRLAQVKRSTSEAVDASATTGSRR